MPVRRYEPDDADTVLADFGVPVSTTGHAEVRGLFAVGAASDDVAGAAVEAADTVLSLKPGALGAITIDQALTVDGIAYRVLGPADGARTLFERWRIAEVIA